MAQRAMSTNKRPFHLSILAVLVALILTACGGRVDTTFTLEEDGSGSRVMNVTVSQEDREKVQAETSVIEESINRHLPPELDFSGLEEADGGLTTTFTINFDSTDDYLAKVKAILNAGDVAWNEDRFNFDQGDGTFRTGVQLREGFSSMELLQWLVNGLLADGIIDSSNRSNILEMGSNSIVHEGTTIEASTYLAIDELEDKGFSGVSMTTTLKPEGADRSIAFQLGQKALYNSTPELYDDYFSALESDGFTVEKSDGERGLIWTARFSAASDDEVAAKTDRALASEESTFKRSEEFTTEGRVQAILTVTEFAECSNICNAAEGAMVADSITPLEEYRTEGQDERTLTFYDQAGTAQFHRDIMLDSAAINVNVEKDGPVSWLGTFALPEADAEVARDAFVKLLSQGGAEATAQEGSNEISVQLQGDNVGAFNRALAAWSNRDEPGLGFTLTEIPEGDFKGSTMVNGSLELPGTVSRVLEQPPTYAVEFQGFGDVNPEAEMFPNLEVEGSTVRGPMDEGFYFMLTPASSGALPIIAGIIVLAVVAGGAAFWFLRKKGAPSQ